MKACDLLKIIKEHPDFDFEFSFSEKSMIQPRIRTFKNLEISSIVISQDEKTICLTGTEKITE